MWRQLLEYTDQTGRRMVAIAAALLVVGIVSFVVGVVRASTGYAATTLPFWLTTMGGAVAAGLLVFAASRRGDLKRQ